MDRRFDSVCRAIGKEQRKTVRFEVGECVDV